MAEGKTYELPRYLKSNNPYNRFGGAQDDFSTSKEEYYKRINPLSKILDEKMTWLDSSDLVVAAAFGEVSLPHVIPDITSKDIEKFKSFDTYKAAALYALMCSSLYYETLAGNIPVRKGKKIAGTIYDLFHASEFAGKETHVSRSFSSGIKEGSEQRKKEIPEELVEILDYPLLLNQNFELVFNRVKTERKKHPPSVASKM